MMRLPSASEWLFAGKSLLASLLALFIALRLDLPRPFWSMLTAYVVANPFAGAVRSKAVFRVGGTVLGATAMVFLVPRLANAPELLSLALALWVAACLFVSLLDRTPRSYVFMLAGYTAALIGFPAVTQPIHAFDIGLARVEEITLGIVCASLVHSLILPQSLGAALLARLDHALGDAQHWMVDALRGDTESQGARDRRKLAADITELRVMSTHLPFDVSHLRWTAAAIRVLQDRLSTLVPLLSAIEDRLHALQAEARGALDERWHMLLDAIAQWGAAGASAPQGQAARLHDEIDRLTPAIKPAMEWSAALKLNLAARLHAAVDYVEECRDLRQRIGAVAAGAAPSAMAFPAAAKRQQLHLDRGLALLSSFAAMIAILACCAFWIATAWPSGAAAPMMAAVFCCFFATQDDPVPGIMRFLTYTLLSIPVSAVYLLMLLPAIHSFAMLALVIAPTFLVLGVLIARPSTSASAMAFLFGVAGALSLQDTGSADLVPFANGMLAQIGGLGAAALFTRLLRSVSVEWTARRLLRTGWSELAALGSTGRLPSLEVATARMVDRVGLLTARLAVAGRLGEFGAVDALGDLRIGLNMTQLAAIRQHARPGNAALDRLMPALSDHFRGRLGGVQAPAPEMLERIDDTLRDACERGDREAVTALVGIRRNLFPAAAAYAAAEGAVFSTKELR